VHQVVPPPRTIRFGAYELDVRAGELRKNGLRVKLQDQPFQVLSMLLERPGELVTRDELRAKLWPDGTFVDFEHSLNTSVKKLREALGDQADNPRFVETLHRRGYRFIAPVNGNESAFAQEALPASTVTRRQVRKNSRALIVATVVATGAFAAWLVLWWVVGGGGVFSVKHARPLTSGAQVMAPNRDYMFFPHIVTDGARLYFSVLGNRISVGQVAFTGGEFSTLSLPIEAFVLQISPDNSKLLLREVTERMQPEGPLWEVSTTGKNLIRVGDIVAQDAAWSPDGKRLSFAKGRDLYVANKNGSEVKKIGELDGYAYWIRWSRDGKRLRFTLVDKNLSTSLREILQDGTNLHSLLPDWDATIQPCCGEWSRDGEMFAFTALKDARSDAWVLREGWFPVGSWSKNLARLTDGPISYQTVIFSQGEEKLYAVSGVSQLGNAKFDLRTREIRPILSDVRGVEIQYSPDHTWITYVNDSGLWRSRADGSEPLQLTRPPLQSMLPRWSPDGKRIAFTGKLREGPYKVYLINRDGGTPRALVGGTRNEIDSDWSPDGRMIIFGRPPDIMGEAGEPKAIHLLSLENGQMSTLPGSERLFSPRWSKDGRYIAGLTVALPSTLMLFDVAAQKWRPMGVTGGNLVWANDSKSLFLTGYDQDPDVPVYRVWLDGRIETLVDLRKAVNTPFSGCDCCSGPMPDGSPILVCGTGSSEIYELGLGKP